MVNVMLEIQILDVFFFFGMSSDVPPFKIGLLQVTLDFELG